MEKLALLFQKSLQKGVDYFIALLKVLIQSSWSIRYPKHNGEGLIILGNGPSLMNDLQLVQESTKHELEYMAVNFFVTSPLFKELKPKHYVLCDPLFFDVNQKDEQFSRIEAFYKHLYEDCAWEMDLFIPNNKIKSFNVKLAQLGLNNHLIHVYPYNKTSMNGENKFYHLLYSKGYGIPRPTTVLIPCLMIGVNMGYKYIGLTGAGHNYHEGIAMSKGNVLQIKVPHFYENKEEVVHKPYYKPGSTETYTISELFLVLHKMFGSYKYVSKFAVSRGVEIVNYTLDSYIDEIKKVTNGSS